MNNFNKLSSTSQSKRLSCYVTMATAGRREIEHRDKLKHLERKMSLELTSKERQHQQKLKWNAKAEVFIHEKLFLSYF